jgi:hypothetical protein
VAVTFDAVGPSSAGAAFTASPGTWTHVNGGNGILVGVTIFNGSSNTVTGVTYGGVTVPLLGFIAGGSGGAGGVALCGLTGGTCPVGSNTVSVAFSDGGSNHNAGSVSVAGAGSLGTAVTNTGTNTTSVAATVTGTTTGGLIVSAASYGSQNAFVADGNSTISWSRLTSSSSGSDNGVMGTTTDPGGGASRTVTWTTNPTNPDFWGVVAVEVLPPAAVSGIAAVPYSFPQMRTEQIPAGTGGRIIRR